MVHSAQGYGLYESHGPGKAYSSLMVFLDAPEAANKVITKGFVEGGEVKLVERFMTGCGLVKCFKCYTYGHIAKNCRAKAHCGHCSDSHETRDCKEQTKKSYATAKLIGYTKRTMGIGRGTSCA
jgi:hypothetical protein